MHHIYRLYDCNGKLLYVGCTADIKSRMSMHKSSTPWYKEISTGTFELVDGKAAALDAKHNAIMNESPLYNKNKRTMPISRDLVKYHRYLAMHASIANKMAKLRSDGWTLQKIADRHGLSRQRVHQILKNR